MRSVDQLVLCQLQTWLQRGDACWLCTIVKTVGASPRPLGSLLALNVSGEVVGSLSGGCIEDDLLEKLQRGGGAQDRPLVMPYGVTAEENERLGLPCGGRLEVLVEPLVKSPEVLPDIIGSLERRQCVRRLVNLETGQWSLEPLEYAVSLKMDGQTLRQDFGPHFQLLLVGANELARCIAEIALAMDYRVMVCDPREGKLAQFSVEGVDRIESMPDDAVRQFASDQHSIVITLTHDPRVDDMALMEALTTDAFYVGALGSQRTSDKRRERLLLLDITQEQLDRLHAPVGLPIGSKSAMEIAVAVMAELTQQRSEMHKGVTVAGR